MSFVPWTRRLIVFLIISTFQFFSQTLYSATCNSQISQITRWLMSKKVILFGYFPLAGLISYPYLKDLYITYLESHPELDIPMPSDTLFLKQSNETDKKKKIKQWILNYMNRIPSPYESVEKICIDNSRQFDTNTVPLMEKYDVKLSCFFEANDKTLKAQKYAFGFAFKNKLNEPFNSNLLLESPHFSDKKKLQKILEKTLLEKDQITVQSSGLDPLPYIELTLKIKSPVQESIQLLLWFEKRTDDAVLVHWVQMKPSGTFNFSRGFMVFKKDDEHMNATFFQILVFNESMGKWKRYFAFRAIYALAWISLVSFSPKELEKILKEKPKDKSKTPNKTKKTLSSQEVKK